jgi:hypothetical protein
MEKTDQELIDIADKMLANLEKEYWDVQQHNINFDALCPENQESEHADYQLLDNDDGPEEMESASDEDAEEEAKEPDAEEKGKNWVNQ